MTELLDYRRVSAHIVHNVDTRLEPDPESISVTLTREAHDAVQAAADWTRISAEWIEGLPRRLVDAYAGRAWSHRHIREVDPGVWVASVAGLDGAYGDGESAEDASEDLREAIVGWVAVRRRLGLEIPPIEGLDLNIPRIAT